LDATEGLRRLSSLLAWFVFWIPSFRSSLWNKDHNVVNMFHLETESGPNCVMLCVTTIHSNSSWNTLYSVATSQSQFLSTLIAYSSGQSCRIRQRGLTQSKEDHVSHLPSCSLWWNTSGHFRSVASRLCLLCIWSCVDRCRNWNPCQACALWEWGSLLWTSGQILLFRSTRQQGQCEKQDSVAITKEQKRHKRHAVKFGSRRRQIGQHYAVQSCLRWADLRACVMRYVV
jgi:hypothetical protein